MQNFVQKLHEQGTQLDSLADRVEKMLSHRRSTAMDGDRVNYKFIDHVEFVQQDVQARDIVFPIPENTEFVAKSLSIFPFFRFITTDEATNGPAENTFRPCVFTTNENVFLPNLSADAAAVDLFIALSETYRNSKGEVKNRAYQNMPFPVEFLRSNSVNYRRAGETANVGPNFEYDRYYAGFEFPSTFMFDCDYVLPAGSNFRITIAPGFAGVRVDPATPGADPSQQNEYRVVAVLDGYKVVRS